MADRIADAVRMVALLAGVVALVVVAMPPQQEAAAAALPGGSYVVAVADEAFAVWVPETGDPVVVADPHVDVRLATDERGRPLSRFQVEVHDRVWDVEIDTRLSDVYLTSVAPMDVPTEQVVVATSYEQAEDAVRSATQDGATQDEETRDEPERLFDPGETPMADRVNGVAEVLKRGTDRVSGAADRIVDAVRGGEARPEGPTTPAEVESVGSTTPATPATPADPGSTAPATPAQPGWGDDASAGRAGPPAERGAGASRGGGASGRP